MATFTHYQRQHRLSVTSLLTVMALTSILFAAKNNKGRRNRHPSSLITDADEAADPNTVDDRTDPDGRRRLRRHSKFSQLSDPRTVVPRLTTEAACWDFMINTGITLPATQDEAWTEENWGRCTSDERALWAASDCVTTLGAYNVEEYGPGDTLPESITTPALSPEDLDRLGLILERLERRLAKLEIPHVMVFSTALGIQRRGGMMPWDDGVEMAIDESRVGRLVEGLRAKERTPWCDRRMRRRKQCNVWVLDEAAKIDIVHKAWGTPWKAIMNGERLPSIDINTYAVSEGRMIIPAGELENGHHGEFSAEVDLMFPAKMAWMTIGRRDIVVPTPNDAGTMLRQMYGEDALDVCVAPNGHGMICKGMASCESATTKRLARARFPCLMIPSSRGG